MTKCILDTNTWLHILTGNSITHVTINGFPVFSEQVMILLPAAIKAELLSLVLQRNWSHKRVNETRKKIDACFLIHTNDEIVEKYAEIDAYSQGKLHGKPLGMSARNMGKNDLWIAATAAVANAVLISKDGDFDHLNVVYLELIKF
ncbi:MAG: PIN domain-containing protein [Chitinophagaceae bacterium]|nr:PIN domain-containing protein [Chitinophagaceae bacterium]